MNDIMHKITSKRSRLSFASGILLATTACLCLLFGLSQDGQAQGQSGSDMGDRGRQSQTTGTQTRHSGPLTAGPRGPGNQGGPYTRDDYHDTGNGNQNNERNGQQNQNNGGGGGGGAPAARPGISGTGVACVAAEAADKLGEFNIDPSMASIAGNGRAKRQAGKTGPTNMKDLYKLGTSIATAGTLDFAKRLIKDAAKEEATGTADLVK